MLVDELDTQIRNARPVPLTDQVRLEPDAVYDVLGRMRTTLPGADPALALIDRCDDVMRNAEPVPLTSQVRIEKGQIYDLIDQMRAAGAKEPRPR
jgi:hypothetical protein